MGLFSVLGSVASGVVDFAKGAFDKVSTFVSNASGTAVGAVASSALKGASYGAVVGAAHSAITGGDIKKGALRGAAVGGVFSGVTKSIMEFSDMNKYTPDQQINDMGYSGPGVPERRLADLAAGTPETVKPTMTETLYKPSESLLKPKDTSAWWKPDTPEKAKLYGGILGGAAQGGLGWMAAKEKAEADKKWLERKTQIDRQKIKDNQPSTAFDQKTARISMREWWGERVA